MQGTTKGNGKTQRSQFRRGRKAYNNFRVLIAQEFIIDLQPVQHPTNGLCSTPTFSPFVNDFV